MKFIDRVKITVESGAGGDGCVSFRREKYVPRGGPDGGDGGRGGDVVFRTDPQLSTLIDYRYKREYRAGSGAHGRGSRMSGKDGDTIVLRVPPGTQILDETRKILLADLTEGEFIAVRGGKGGRGNTSFATSTRRTPRFSEPGQPGQAIDLVLELKLIADVGIVGMPNAGKSTMISRISAARPKVAEYPFTTLVPSLGVVRTGDNKSIVVADIPGLVEGAHQGVGLGHQFLRHVERTSVILHLIGLAPGDPDPVEAFRTVRSEMEKYAEELAHKESIVALNKVDLYNTDDKIRIMNNFLKETDVQPHLVSAASGDGITELVRALGDTVSRNREERQ
jgi:GTP-binding protein